MKYYILIISLLFAVFLGNEFSKIRAQKHNQRVLSEVKDSIASLEYNNHFIGAGGKKYNIQKAFLDGKEIGPKEFNSLKIFELKSASIGFAKNDSIWIYLKSN